MSTETLIFPPFTLDPSNVCLWRGRKRIPLTPKDFAVLHYLAAQAGRLVPQQELLSAVWPDTLVSVGILKVRLRRIRQVLGDNATKPRFIEIIHGLGYRFIAPLSTSPSTVSSSRFHVPSSLPSLAPSPNTQPLPWSGEKPNSHSCTNGWPKP